MVTLFRHGARGPTHGLLFDVNNDWNSKNKNQQPKGRWEEALAPERPQGKMQCLISLFIRLI